MRSQVSLDFRLAAEETYAFVGHASHAAPWVPCVFAFDDTTKDAFDLRNPLSALLAAQHALSKRAPAGRRLSRAEHPTTTSLSALMHWLYGDLFYLET